MNGQTDEWKDENYIPLGINAEGIKSYIFVEANAMNISAKVSALSPS